MGWRMNQWNRENPPPQNCWGSGKPGSMLPMLNGERWVMCNNCNGRFITVTGHVPIHPESAAWPNGKDEFGNPL